MSIIKFDTVVLVCLCSELQTFDSDGLRYGVYIRNEKNFKLHAYMNLTDLKDDHPIYNCYGVKEALRVMTPDWNDKKPNNLVDLNECQQCSFWANKEWGQFITIDKQEKSLTAKCT